MKVMYFLAALVIGFSLALDSPQTSNSSSSPVPDFSGAWQLDRKQSTNTESLRLPDITLVISQRDSILNVTRTVKDKKKERVQELTYYMDGRGEKNPTLFGGEKRESKSSWSSSKLVSKYALTSWSSGTNRYYIQPVTETWELSKDGQILTMTAEVGEVKNASEFFEREWFKPYKYRKVFKRIQWLEVK